MSKLHEYKIKIIEIIEPHLNKLVSHLSGGERRLLEIILLIHSNAQYILLDEPFNGVAPLYKDVIKQYIKEQAQEKGFIITDHDYRNIIEISTRMVLIRDGGTIAINNREELVDLGYILQ